MGKAPFGQENECSTENQTPQEQCWESLAESQPYQRATASWKAVLNACLQEFTRIIGSIYRTGVSSR